MADFLNDYANLRSNFYTIGTIPDLNFRFVVGRNSAIAAEAAERHRASPQVHSLLGETMLVTFFLATHSVKIQERVSLHLECSGAAHRIISFAASDGSMRGTASRPDAVWTGKPSAGKGSGILRVNRWRNDRGRAYSSAVEMRDVSLDRNIEEYLGRSDQIQSFIRLETSFDNRAGRMPEISGYMFQALPGATPDQVDQILDMIGGRSPTQLIETLLPAPDGPGGIQLPVSPGKMHSVNLLKNGSFFFACECSREKVRNTLFMMGRDSIESLVEEKGCVEVFCEFCKKRYELSPSDVDALFKEH